MQTQAIVTRLLQCCVALMHASRWQVLRDVVVSAVCGKALTLTALALGTMRATSVRHRVKCVDRLLANRHLESERIEAYRALAHQWLSGLPQLLIVVDWSSLTADLKWHWLRASVVVDGRSITLYEEVHARKHLAARKVHRRFIERLAALVPASERRPIILTDAGFRTPWFRLIAQQGWYWIGRTRNRDFVRRQDGQWFAAKSLYAQATEEAKDLGVYEAVRNHPLVCRFALIKTKPTGRQRKYPSGKVTNNSSARKIAQRYREPWLASLPPRTGLSRGLGNRQALRPAHAHRAAVSRYQESRARHGSVAIEESRSTAATGAAVHRAHCAIGQALDRRGGKSEATGVATDEQQRQEPQHDFGDDPGNPCH